MSFSNGHEKEVINDPIVDGTEPLSLCHIVTFKNAVKSRGEQGIFVHVGFSWHVQSVKDEWMRAGAWIIPAISWGFKEKIEAAEWP